MFLLLSSGARPRYRDDIIRVLALPLGGELQFRYERSLIAEDLLARFRSNDLRRETGLICYLSAGNRATPTQIVPCRFASILYTEVVGTSHIIRLEMREFAQIDEEALKKLLAPSELILRPSLGMGSRISGGQIPIRSCGIQLSGQL